MPTWGMSHKMILRHLALTFNIIGYKFYSLCPWKSRYPNIHKDIFVSGTLVRIDKSKLRTECVFMYFVAEGDEIAAVTNVVKRFFFQIFYRNEVLPVLQHD